MGLSILTQTNYIMALAYPIANIADQSKLPRLEDIGDKALYYRAPPGVKPYLPYTTAYKNISPDLVIHKKIL